MRRIIFLLVVAALTVSLAGCTDAMAKKVFMYGFEKAIGGNPEPIEVKPIKVVLTLDLQVGKAPKYISAPFEPAYPQKVDLWFLLAHDKKALDQRQVEKWVDREGKTSATTTFARVYPGDFVGLHYDLSLWSSSFQDQDGVWHSGYFLGGSWDATYEAIVARPPELFPDPIAGRTVSVRSDDTGTTYYVTVKDVGRLGMSNAPPP